MRKIDDTYFNLDSKLDEPKVIGDDKDFQSYLRTHLKKEETQLLLVVENSIAESEAWKLEICNS